MAQEGPRSIGRYALHGEIGSGGMATVYLGRLLGIGGFSRTVAIKRLRPAFAKDPAFAAMLLDEARLASRIRHPNVVSTLDVGYEGGELFIVLDYVHGEPLSRLIPASHPEGVPADIAVAILAGTLRGLHAAHEARGRDGSSLGLVHRDVSPQNVLVGADGIARVLDFGVAKAAGRVHQTRGGEVKGKIAYMAREQLHGGPLDRRADVYSAAVVLWETLVGERLFSDLAADSGPRSFRPASHVVPSVPEDLDDIVACGLAEDREGRFTTAEAMAVALENAVKPASPERVAAWLGRVAGDRLRERAALVAEVEGAESRSTMPISPVANALRETPSRPTAELTHGPETAPMTPRPGEPSQRTLLSATVDYDSERHVPSGGGAARSRPPVVTVEDPPAPTRGGVPLVMVAIVAAVVGAAIVVVLFVTSRGSPSPTTSTPIAASPSSISTPAATVDPAPPAATVARDDPPEAPRSAEPTAHATRPARTSPKPHPAQLPPPPKSTCDPPYRVDADGTQHPKPECF